MKTLFITGEYPPRRGGVGDFTHHVAREFVTLGDEPHVLTSAAPQPASTVEDGVHVHRTAAPWGWGTRSEVSRLARKIGADAINLQYQAAAFNMHGAINLLSSLRVGRAPFVLTFHDLRVPYLFPKAGLLRKRAIYHMARAASGVIVTNPEDEAELARQKISSSVIPIGSNVRKILREDFVRNDWKHARNIPIQRKLFAYFGFMNDSKGGEVLLRALRLLVEGGHDAGLVFIGEQLGASDPTNSGYRQNLRALIDQLQLKERVTQTGFLDDAGVSEAFAASDCVALPYVDGVSMRRGTFMAALANVCAIVTTQPEVPFPGLSDEHNALLIPRDDPAALANAIARVLSDHNLQSQLCKGAAALSSHFGWSAIAAATRGFLSSRSVT